MNFPKNSRTRRPVCRSTLIEHVPHFGRRQIEHSNSCFKASSHNDSPGFFINEFDFSKTLLNLLFSMMIVASLFSSPTAISDTTQLSIDIDPGNYGLVNIPSTTFTSDENANFALFSLHDNEDVRIDLISLTDLMRYTLVFSASEGEELEIN